MKTYEGQIEGKGMKIRCVQVLATNISDAYEKVSEQCEDGEFNRGVILIDDDE